MDRDLNRLFAQAGRHMSRKQMNKYTLVIKKGKIKHKKILLEKSSVCSQGMEMVAAFRAVWHYLMILEIFTVYDSAVSVLDIFMMFAYVHQMYTRMFFVALHVIVKNQK